MSKPKLLVTASTFPRFVGDTEPPFVFDLSRQLLKEFEVTVLVPASPEAKPRENMEGLEVIRYHYAPTPSLETLVYPGSILARLKENPLRLLQVPLLLLGLYRALDKLLKEEVFDLIHCHWLIPQGLIQSFFINRPYSPPYVVTGHGADVLSLKLGMIQKLKKHTIKQSAAVTVVSSQLQQELVQLMDTEKVDIRVMPMGCHLSKFSPELRQEGYFKNFGLKSPVILFVGRLAEKKGVTYLIKALTKFPLNQSSASLAIVGDGPLKSTLMKEVTQLGLERRVHFFGPLNHEELPKIYASADIFCCPSIVTKSGDSEGLGMVIIEAGSSGLPVVATRVGGIPDAVVDGKTGILVPEQNSTDLALALTELIMNPEKRKIMGKAAIKHVQKFSWDIVGKGYGELFYQVIKNHKK